MRYFQLNPHRPLWTTFVLVALAGVLTGCGTSADQAANTRPEMSTVTVGSLPIVDSASLYVAIKKGYFADEGLDVQVKTLPSGAAAIPGLATNELQFAIGNYVSFFTAHTTGKLDVKLVADAYQAKPGIFLIMVKGNSKITKPMDLTGKKIAVNSRNSVIEMTARSVLGSAGVNVETVNFVPMPFPDMAGALSSGAVDAAYMVEPYVTESEKNLGAVPIVDAASGPTAEMPIAGWVTNANLAKEMPNTVRAFQRAILKGQAASADRVTVEQVLNEYLDIDALTTSLVALGTWPTTLEATRIQRVIDLMAASGQLPKPIDPRSIIIPPPPDT
jgi:NitT/TauT family transport system substrate-binding protein